MTLNFSFLHHEFPILETVGTSAETYLHQDPVYCLVRLRLFGEKLTELLFKQHNAEFPADNTFHNRLKVLDEDKVLPGTIRDLFFQMRKRGNLAAHDGKGTLADARQGLMGAFRIGKWFYQTYSDENDDISGLQFVEPPAVQPQQQALAELESRYKALQQALADALAQRNTTGLAPAQQQTIQARSQRAVRKMDLSEAETRNLIDEALRRAGWEVDTPTLNYKKHKSGPEKGKNRAIAEWPAGSGWADYALFVGTTLYGIVEAKRYAQDISTDLGQSKQYAAAVQALPGTSLPGPVWNTYRVPFLFSTNGRPYLEQIKTKSGIWFLDARLPANLARCLQGWYTPEGLVKLYGQDVAAANQKIASSSLDFLANKNGLGLYTYQIDAIRAVEAHLLAEPPVRRALVAMATGTGKTRTVIGLCYHLIQSNRFRRILFLVDRTLLGTQALNAFNDNKVISFNTFADIYGVKTLADQWPDADTRLHFATVQSLVRRLTPEDPDGMPPNDMPPAVDQYDCLIIDEAHRGYTLDRELSDDEFGFKNQQDYVSKYRMVLDYFDAWAIGLTATPALHTTQIFGRPIYTYSYREAVIDGYLIDHDPPMQIKTKLSEEGIRWTKGEKPKALDPDDNTLVELAELDDELQIEVDGFNREVLTLSFNQTVAEQLAQQIDPAGPDKTLIFAANDAHADLVVQCLKDAYEALGIPITDDAIQKITGKSYNPAERVRHYKNEQFPTIAVTVDLLTTGIDVPPISTLVFLRRVRSRILYEQMLGRATRRCDEIGKTAFRIFDAVRLYEALDPYTQMQPVVANPTTTFRQLADELPAIDAPRRAVQQIEQLVAKLQRKKRTLTPDDEQTFGQLSGGASPDELIGALRQLLPADALARVGQLGPLWTYLDELKPKKNYQLVSDHADQFLELEVGYGTAGKPADYLTQFAEFLRQNQNQITALQTICTRPADLSRAALRDLLVTLAQHGYVPRNLSMAWKQVRNEDMGADVIAMIRTQMLGVRAESRLERTHRAIQKVKNLQPWSVHQLKWLDRFGKQLEAEAVLQLEDLDKDPFDAAGGFQQLNKIFNNNLPTVIRAINEEMWA